MTKIRAPRFDVEFNVVCESTRGLFSGRVVDMSESGLFIETDHSLEIGVECTLVPNVTDDSQLPAELKATVVRVADIGLEGVVNAPGIAFRLIGLTIAEFNQVRTFLRKHGSTPRRK